MAAEINTPYPGDLATPFDIRRLAEEYHRAAYRAAADIRSGEPLSAAPLRLLALQSVELHLSALLMLKGASWQAVRRNGHDLAARLELATAQGLVLRRKTADHVAAVARDREYLVARYGPDCLAKVSQVNRLLATLDEVGAKVSRAFEQASNARAAAVGPADAADVARPPSAG